MTSSLPTEDAAPGLGRAWCVVFQHGPNSSTSIRLRPDIPLDEMTNILLGEYTGVPSDSLRYLTRSISEVVTPEEPVHLESRTGHVRPAAIISHGAMRPLVPPLRSNNSSFNSEADSSGGARQPPVDGESGSNETLPVRSKITTSRMAVIIVGALVLVVVPGLVLGVVAKQIPWGIALSGAIATVVSFFAGLYYYHNR